MPLKDWALELLGEVEACIYLRDSACGGSVHAKVWSAQRQKVMQSECTPSAQVLEGVHSHGGSLAEFSLRCSVEHAKYFRSRPLESEVTSALQRRAQLSRHQQQLLDAGYQESFADYVQRCLPVASASVDTSAATRWLGSIADPEAANSA